VVIERNWTWIIMAVVLALIHILYWARAWSFSIDGL